MGKGTSQLAKKVIKSARKKSGIASLLDSRHLTMTSEQIYKQFLLVNLDCKGHMASGYGSTGWKVSVQLGLNLGDLVLPGFFTAGATIEGSVSKSDFVLVAIHRNAPRKICPTVDSVHSNLIWETSNPISLLAFFGKSYEVSKKVSLNLSIGASGVMFPQSQSSDDKISMLTGPLGLEINTDINKERKIKVLRLCDSNPAAYPNQSDTKLKNDLVQFVDLGKAKFKEQTQKMILELNKFFDNVPKTPNAEKDRKRDAVRQISLIIDDPSLDKSEIFKTVIQKGKAKIAKELWKIVGSPLENVDIKALNANTSELKGEVTEVLKKIPNNDDDDVDRYNSWVKSQTIASGNGGLKEDKLEKLKDTLASIKNLLNYTNDKLAAYKANEDVLAKGSIPKKQGSKLKEGCEQLSFIDFVSTEESKEASIAATISNVHADTFSKGFVKSSCYRYQMASSNKDKKILVYTQDTQIDYRSAELKAEIIYKENSKEKSKSSTAMTYTSACVYWLYPPKQKNIVPGLIKVTEVIKGSGVSFGVSVNLASLKGFISDVKSKSEEYKFEIALLASYLCLPIDVFYNYLLDFEIKVLEKVQKKNISLLFESSFALDLSNKKTVTASAKTKDKTNALVIGPLFNSGVKDQGSAQTNKPNEDSINLDDFITKLRDTNQTELRTKTLDSIRLRCRLVDKDEVVDAASSDSNEKSTTYFKLGASAVASGGIELAKIESAGQSGMLDLSTAYYSNLDVSAISDGGSGSVDAYDPKSGVPEDDEGNALLTQNEAKQLSEEAVPPVVLLYQ